jgi:hypothetical protein
VSANTLFNALHRIVTDLDVACTCHLVHGPLCPKRMARAACEEHLKEAPPVVYRSLRADEGAVEAVARAIHAVAWGSEENPKPIPWDTLEPGARDAFLTDARVAIEAIDKYMTERTTT